MECLRLQGAAGAAWLSMNDAGRTVDQACSAALRGRDATPVGPHRGRGPAEPRGQPRTAGDNERRGQRPFHGEVLGRESPGARFHTADHSEGVRDGPGAGSGVLVGDGEQVASPLHDLAAVSSSDPVHPLVQVRGPVERHRPGELRASHACRERPAPIRPPRRSPRWPGWTPQSACLAGTRRSPRAPAGRTVRRRSRAGGAARPGWQARRPLRVQRLAEQFAWETPGAQA